MKSFFFGCRSILLAIAAVSILHGVSRAEERGGCGPGAGKSGYEIGVYYYPGWHTVAGRPKAVRSAWDPIYGYPDRKPLLGWYNGNKNKVISKQIDWMCNYGLSYVVFDWYSDYNLANLNDPLKTYMSLPGDKVKFSLLWANHTQRTTTREWYRIVDFWAANYLNDDRFYSIDGRKVIFIFSLDRMADDAKMDGASLAQWLQHAQDVVKARGGKGLYFVGGVNAGSLSLGAAADSGVSALSAYNYQSGPRDKQAAHGYAALDQAYRRQWAALSNVKAMSLVVPITAGWDRRPWGGSPDPGRDNSMATPSEFYDHLSAARATMDANGVRRGVICCWNEYGEGSVIEPTRRNQFKMLEAVKRAFAP